MSGNTPGDGFPLEEARSCPRRATPRLPGGLALRDGPGWQRLGFACFVVVSCAFRSGAGARVCAWGFPLRWLRFAGLWLRLRCFYVYRQFLTLYPVILFGYAADKAWRLLGPWLVIVVQAWEGFTSFCNLFDGRFQIRRWTWCLEPCPDLGRVGEHSQVQLGCSLVASPIWHRETERRRIRSRALEAQEGRRLDRPGLWRGACGRAGGLAVRPEQAPAGAGGDEWAGHLGQAWRAQDPVLPSPGPKGWRESGRLRQSL